MALRPAERAARFRGSFPRSTAEIEQWLAQRPAETIIDPDQPLIDAHHHIFGQAGDRNHYDVADFARDLERGHRVLGTVYVEAYRSGWHAHGPEELKPVGEVESIVSRTPAVISLPSGPCEIAAGIVAFADLTLGDKVSGVLEALAEAGRGRLSGIRHRAAVASGVVGRSITELPRPHLLASPDFRAGIARLEPFELPFDVWIYHDQIPELIDLVDAFPQTMFVLNHLGAPIGVAESQREIDEARIAWEQQLRRLASRPNVVAKVGGMGMTVFGFGFELERLPPTSEMLARAWSPLFDICVEAFGPDRCMFETNYPADQQSAGYAVIWNALKRLAGSLAESERASIFYRCAASVYRLDDLGKRCDAAGNAIAPTA